MNLTIKMLGAALILLAAMCYGFSKVHAERNKIRETEAFCDFVRYIRDNIEHFSKPLPNIFAEYENGYFMKTGLGERIKIIGIKSALAEYDFSMPREDADCMLKFSREIGGGYREDELRLCDYTVSRLEKSVSGQKSDINDKEKMYKTIPILLAASVILLLI